MWETAASETWAGLVERGLAGMPLPALLAQLLGVAAAFALARLLAPRLRGWLRARRRAFEAASAGRREIDAMAGAALPMALVLLLWPAVAALALAGLPYAALDIAASLLTAWLVIRVAAALLVNPALARLVAVVAWTLAALNITGLLAPTVRLLDGLAIGLGAHRISVLAIVTAVLWLAALVWIALLAARLIERRLQTVAGLTPSMQVLLGKLVRVTLLVMAVVVTLDGVGMDLTALTVFGGAVGLGPGLRPAEGGVEPGLGHHPAARQVGEARRRRRHQRHLWLDQRAGGALCQRDHPRRHRAPDPQRGADHQPGRELVLLEPPGAAAHPRRHLLRQRPAPGHRAVRRGGAGDAAHPAQIRRRAA